MPTPPRLTRVSRLGAVNAFLVAEDDGLTLIDTLIARSADRIFAAAGRLGVPIVRIALTHAHADHIGSLDALAEALPAAEVLISTRDARFLAGDMSLDPGEPQSKLRGGYPQTRTRPGQTLEPGDRVGSLEAIAAPGSSTTRPCPGASRAGASARSARADSSAVGLSQVASPGSGNRGLTRAVVATPPSVENASAQ